MLVAVGGIQRLLERDAAAPREPERVRSLRHHLIAGEQAIDDLDKLVVLLAQHDWGAHEGVRQIEVFHIDDPARGSPCTAVRGTAITSLRESR